MLQRIYPADQVERYLYIDVITLVLLFYNVLHSDSLNMMWGLLMLVAFVGSFYVILWYRDWRIVIGTFVGCTVLALLGIFYNEWLLLFGFLIADPLGRAHSRVYMVTGIGIIFAMHLTTTIVLHGDILSFVATDLLPILIIQMATPLVIYYVEKSRTLKNELALLNEKLEKYSKEEERHRIARDLHDTLGQTLTMIKLKSELAIRFVDQNAEQAKKEMTEVIGTSRFALKQVREVVTSMRHVSLENELQDGKQLLETAGITLFVEQHPHSLLPPSDSRVLSEMTETMLSYSVREAITNIIKHSKATSCIVTMTWRENRTFQLLIKDNGKGFIPKWNSGNGLSSIHERMRLLHGQANITSTSDGARVELIVPLTGVEGMDVS